MTQQQNSEPDETKLRLETSIAKLGLSARTRNALLNANILTLADLKERYCSEGNRLFNRMILLGKISLAELLACEEFRVIQERSRLSPSFNPLSTLPLSKRTREALERENIWNLLELKSKLQPDGRLSVDMASRFGKKASAEINAFLDNLKDKECELKLSHPMNKNLNF
jgi:DNA-directed RNA polymerase alpha subunit